MLVVLKLYREPIVRRRRRRRARIPSLRTQISKLEDLLCCALLDGADPGWHRRQRGGPVSCPARSRMVFAVDEFRWRLEYGGPHKSEGEGEPDGE